MKYIFQDSIENVSLCTLDLQEQIPVAKGALVVLPYALAQDDNSIIDLKTTYIIKNVCIDITQSCVFVWVEEYKNN